jgi:hypothetical protein
VTDGNGTIRNGQGGGRDERGRFSRAAGWRGGPGSARLRRLGAARAAALSIAAIRAIRPGDLGRVLRRLLTISTQSEDEAAAVAASKALLDRVVGRAREQDPLRAPLAVELGALVSPQDCADAVSSIASAFVAGAVDQSAAALLLGIVQTRAKVLELVEHERRIVELERAARAESGRRW